MTPVAIAIVLLVVVFGAAAAVMIPAYLRQRVDWKQLPGTGAHYSVVGAPISEAQLIQAYYDACTLLRRHTDFTPTTIGKMASTLYIAVQAVDSWGQDGRKVAGTASGTTLYVGRNLKSLLHEMAHACEWLEGVQDFDHKTWMKRGIFAAQDAFEATLSNQT